MMVDCLKEKSAHEPKRITKKVKKWKEKDRETETERDIKTHTQRERDRDRQTDEKINEKTLISLL